MRIDQYLSTIQLVSRRKSKALLKSGYFTVNGEEVFDPTYQIHANDILCREGQEHLVRPVVTLLIHKPTGYVSSDIDEHGWPSYKQLLIDCPYQAMVHIAGRLDVDTSGLILATSDGQLNHRIISPKLHLPKVYLVTLRDALSESARKQLARGVTLDGGYTTLPAQAELLEPKLLKLTLVEGKFHQVKRMLIAVGNEVTELVRTQIGPWTLDGLPSGSWRILDDSDVALALSQKIST